MSKLLARSAFRFLVLCAMSAVAADAQPLSDESAVAVLVRQAARESAEKLTGAVELRFIPEDTHPVVRQIFAEEFSARGFGVTLGTGVGAYRATVDVRELEASAVSSNNSFYFRTIRARLGVLLENTAQPGAVYAKEFLLSRRDTLDGTAPYARKDFRAEAPPSWLESILEPVVITATAAVIVILLFTVRGS